MISKNSTTLLNFGLITAILFALNLNTDKVANQQINSVKLENGYNFEYNQFAFLENSVSEARLEEMGIVLHPGSDYKPGADGTDRSLNHCKSLVYKTLKKLPDEPVDKLKHLTLYFSDTGRRGLGGGNTVILRCQNVSDEELVAVLVHEMGHIMDTGVMNGNFTSGASAYSDGNSRIYLDDPSVEFYNISWEREDKIRLKSNKYDFVSGYAMTDPFEDFAESYAYYILHGEEFRILATKNNKLKSKYEFLKEKVFYGVEYGLDVELEVFNTAKRHYDVTVLQYDLDNFFLI